MLPSGWRAVASPAGCFDHDDVLRGEFDRLAASEPFDAPVGPLHPVGAGAAGFPAGHAERSDPPVVGQDRNGHRLEEPDASRAAVAAAMLAAPTAPGTDLVA